MSFWVLLALPLIHSACPSYKCSGEVPGNGTCLQYNSTQNTYSITPCEENLACNGTAKEKHCTTKSHPQSISYAGGPCKSSIDCYSQGTCHKGTCRGLAQDKPCVSNYDCDSGLYCFASKCQPQLQSGKIGCLEDSECENSAGCMVLSPTDRSQNLCKEYFTVKDYQAMTNCTVSGTVNYLCDSGFCAKSGLSQCYPAPESGPTFPIECYNSSSQNCRSQPTGALGTVFESDCVCGYNPDGRSFCGLFQGDAPQRDYSKMLREWTSHPGIKKCNTETRFSIKCMEIHWGSANTARFRYRELLGIHYVLLQGAEECTEEVLLPGYWESREEVSTARALLVPLVLVLFI